MDPLGYRWAASGAMALTGRAEGPPLGAPSGLVELMDRATALLRHHTGGQLNLDGLALLGERAALEGWQRRSPDSCGGGTRLLPAADGWVAVARSRPDDVAAFPAWLELDDTPLQTWSDLGRAVSTRTMHDLDIRAALLGLPIAAMASVRPPRHLTFGLPIGRQVVDSPKKITPTIADLVVVDLSSLWAGPLCGALLSQAGADVIKVESASRPDGARRGNSTFFDLLNGAKRSVIIDLNRPDGTNQLRQLLQHADIVIESARPRGLEQMGIVALELLSADSGPKVWVSITSHGRGPEARERVGFGDVAAVGGGLVAFDQLGPVFVADAVTDPLAGLVAAAATLEALALPEPCLLDVAMAYLAAHTTGPLLEVGGLRAEPPRARAATRAAPPLGADTAAVLKTLTLTL